VVDFTTLAKVKENLNLGSTARADADSMLAQMISSVSSTLENNLTRPVKVESRTERRATTMTGIFSIQGGPATSITSVKYSFSGIFTRDGVTLSTSQYALGPGNEYLVIPDYVGPYGFIEVTYVGGLAADTAAIQANFPDLERACITQVCYLWNRRLTMGKSSTTLGNGDTQWVGDYDLLPGVVAMLIKYRRPWAIG
jgi:hypothetical protein